MKAQSTLAVVAVIFLAFPVPIQAYQGITKALWDQLARSVTKHCVDKAENNARSVFNSFFSHPGNDVYDVNINIDSLKGLDEKGGWPISFKDEASFRRFREKQENLVVAVLGVYNRGKSYVLNKLTGRDLPVGLLTHTTGLSMMLPEQDNIFYIDSAGTDQPVKQEDLTDRLASQSFLQ